MSLIVAPRTAQSPLIAYFPFRFDDTMLDVSGNTINFGESILDGTVMAIPLPPGAMVTGGSISSITDWTTTKFEITIGDSLVPARYLTATEKKSTGFTPIIPTGFIGGGENIEFTFDLNDVATTGSAVIVIEYVVARRATEVQIA
jgi:hypothetical protein